MVPEKSTVLLEHDGDGGAQGLEVVRRARRARRPGRVPSRDVVEPGDQLH